MTATIEGPAGSPPDGGRDDRSPELPAGDQDDRDALLRAQLGTHLPTPAWRGWVTAIGTSAFSFVLLVAHLGRPHGFAFDETYYSKDAWSLLHYGYERNWLKTANQLILDGKPVADGLSPGGEWATHPPLGKWMIAPGIEIFGMDPFGWRIMSVVFATLSVFVLTRTVRRMTGSDLLGGTAGLLLAVDGMFISMGRASMLDIFLMAFLVFAFACLVVDRDQGRERLYAFASPRVRQLPLPASEWGPWLGVRWWRVGGAFFLGCACATKWSGIYYVAAFGIMIILWDRSARRAAGIRRSWSASFVKDWLQAGVTFLVVPVAVYVASWIGWFQTQGAYNRDWASKAGKQTDWGWVPDSLRSLWHLHADTLNFHNHLTSPHNYEAGPHQWLILARPTQMLAWYPKCPGSDRECVVDVVALGNPVIWWGGCIAMLWCLGLWIGRRDWRAAAALVGIAAGWVPWFYNIERTTFATYSVAFLPFLVIAITLMLGSIIGPADASANRRTWGATVAGGFVILAVAASYLFYPVWTGQMITRDHWGDLMWFRSWI